MSGRERHIQAGPSDASRLRSQQQQQKPSTNWAMALFGGRKGKHTDSSTHGGLGWGRPGASASARNRDERESLIPSYTGGDDFDDSDAISLLSNIADRDSRRGGSGSAAARRRARARAKAQGRSCSTFWMDVEDWIPSLSCGLLGRGNSNQDKTGRQRAASIGSVMSRGRRSQADEEAVGTLRHSRSASDASIESTGSLAGSGFAESVDADAGMLDDQDIAQFGQPTASSIADEAARTSTELSQAKADEEARAQAEIEAAESQAKRQKALEAEAARLQSEAEEEAQRQKEEEDRLAAEEEAAIAKARRKADRKAAKAGLLRLRQENKASQRWKTEAEAEAAAGGFSLADAEGEDSLDQHRQEEAYAEEHFDHQDVEYGRYDEVRGGEYEQYDDAEEGDDGYYATVQEQGPGGVVHHHHYYHAAVPAAEEEEEDTFVYQPSLSPHSAAAFGEQKVAVPEELADKPVSEDEADIAGLSFGRKKTRSRRNESGSASESRSGGGLTPRAMPNTNASSSSSNSASRPTYRDRPRRGHDRTSSKSSNSSSGIFSYQSSNALHYNAPSTVATSVTSPLARDSDPIYTQAAGVEGGKGGSGQEVEGAQFGKADVDANEFGVITAGSDRGGAGRVKKSWRDKRARSQVAADKQAEGFDGLPEF